MSSSALPHPPVGHAPPVEPSRFTWARPAVGAIGRWWLGTHDGSVRELRRWSWWVWWTRWRTPAQRVRGAVRFGLIPLDVARDILKYLRSSGARVEALHGVPRTRQLRHLATLWVRCGMWPVNYYRFQLFRPERWARAGEYLQIREAEILLRVLLLRVPWTDRCRFADKGPFAGWCQGVGLPTAHTILEVAGTGVVAGAAADLPHADLFTKPVNWYGGQGAERWQWCGGAWVSSDGMRCDAPALVAELQRKSAGVGRTFLVQRFIRNHEALQPLTPGALCTVRIVTVTQTGGVVRPLYAVYRMATGTTPADNFDRGGLAAPVDLETGRLGAAVRKRGAYPVETVTHHPDTGNTIEGHRIPYWRESLRLVTEAHHMAETDVPIVGWDVAVTDDGPVLVEANSVPCSVLGQMPSGQPLGGTPYPGVLTAGLRRAFAI